MDINKAVALLSEREGVTLNCSTQEVVTSKLIEEEMNVLVTSEYEDGKTDKMLFPIGRFKGLYAVQQFVESGPIAPVVDDNIQEDVTDIEDNE